MVTDSCSLVLSWRSFQFSLFWLLFGGIFLLGSFLGYCLSQAKCQVSLTQFSLRCPVSLQYLQVKEGSKEPSTPRANCEGRGLPKYGLLINPLGELSVLLGLPMFKLLATAVVIVSTKNLGSSNCPNFLFCASRLLIWESCCSIFLCLEFFDSLHSPASSYITYEEVSIAAVWELVLPDLLLPPNIIARWPWNWVKLSESSDDWSMIRAIAAWYGSFNLCAYWLFNCSLACSLNSGFLAMILQTRILS